MRELVLLLLALPWADLSASFQAAGRPFSRREALRDGVPSFRITIVASEFHSLQQLDHPVVTATHPSLDHGTTYLLNVKMLSF